MYGRAGGLHRELPRSDQRTRQFSCSEGVARVTTVRFRRNGQCGWSGRVYGYHVESFFLDSCRADSCVEGCVDGGYDEASRNRNRLVKKSMPLAKTTGFLCIFRKKSVVEPPISRFCHSFLLKSVTFLCRLTIILTTRRLSEANVPIGAAVGAGPMFSRRPMFMYSFVVSDRNGLLRGRNSEVFWLLSGVQIPVMHGIPPSGKAEFLSGYDCKGVCPSVCSSRR